MLPRTAAAICSYHTRIWKKIIKEQRKAEIAANDVAGDNCSDEEAEVVVDAVDVPLKKES
jgi:hypothetical protein